MNIMPVVTFVHDNQLQYLDISNENFAKSIYVAMLQKVVDTSGNSTAEFVEFVPCSEL